VKDHKLPLFHLFLGSWSLTTLGVFGLLGIHYAELIGGAELLVMALITWLVRSQD